MRLFSQCLPESSQSPNNRQSFRLRSFPFARIPLSRFVIVHPGNFMLVRNPQYGPSETRLKNLNDSILVQKYLTTLWPNRSLLELSFSSPLPRRFMVSLESFRIHAKNNNLEGRSYCICETCKRGLQGQCRYKRCKCCTAMAHSAKG